jgi:hypothetical protein
VEFRQTQAFSRVLTCKSESPAPINQYELVRYEFQPTI